MTKKINGWCKKIKNKKRVHFWDKIIKIDAKICAFKKKFFEIWNFYKKQIFSKRRQQIGNKTNLFLDDFFFSKFIEFGRYVAWVD